MTTLYVAISICSNSGAQQDASNLVSGQTQRRNGSSGVECTEKNHLHHFRPTQQCQVRTLGK